MFHKQIGLRDYSIIVGDTDGALVDVEGGRIVVNRNAVVGDLENAISAAQSHEQPAEASLPLWDLDE